MNMKILLTTIIAFNIGVIQLNAQCANEANIQTFTHNNKSYEIILESKRWTDAVACAIERGGILAEINDADEQGAVFTALKMHITKFENTVAFDGGDGAYVWLGGNDIQEEGNWIWDGNGDTLGVQFWLGDANGTAVDGQFTNWGMEPDNFSNQDALGISLNGWPFGGAGEWNDIKPSNKLFYIVEYATLLSLEQNHFDGSNVKIYPKPFTNYLIIESKQPLLSKAQILNSMGQAIQLIELKNLPNQRIELNDLETGVYFIQLLTKDGMTNTVKLLK